MTLEETQRNVRLVRERFGDAGDVAAFIRRLWIEIPDLIFESRNGRMYARWTYAGKRCALQTPLIAPDNTHYQEITVRRRLVLGVATWLVNQ